MLLAELDPAVVRELARRQPFERFTPTTITDVNTGLMWEKLSDDGSIHDKDNAYSWTNAFTNGVCSVETAADFSGPWLPGPNLFTSNKVGQTPQARRDLGPLPGPA